MTRIGLLLPHSQRQNLFGDQDLKALALLGELKLNHSDEHLNSDQASELLHDCDIAIGSWGTVHPGDAKLMAACSRIKLWLHAAGSVKQMFGPHLHQRDLCIASAKDAIGADVAEFVHGLMILGLRNYFHRDNNKRSKIGVRTLMRSHVGIVGASSVGRQVIKRLADSGAHLHVFDPFVDEATAAKLGVTLHQDIVAMARQLDVISIHTPMLDSTRHLLNAAVFEALPDHAVVINSSRSECLQQDDLLATLQRGRLQAFLDVTTPEPLPADHPLLSLDNCHVSPHIAGPPSQRIGHQCVSDVQAFLNDGTPKAVITEAMLEFIA